VTNPVEKRFRAESLKRLAETFLGKKNFSWWTLLYASLIFIVTGWLPDGISELLKKEWMGGSYKIAISLLILFIIGIQLKQALNYNGKIEVIRKEPDKVNVLTVFLSVLSMNQDTQKREMEAIRKALEDKSLTEASLYNKSWEMPIIAIKHHLPELKFLYVLTSSGDNGSSQLMSVFKDVVSFLFPNVEVIELKKGGINFEDVREVFDTIEEFYMKVENKVIADKVIVDITGGQKTNSFAGAIATLVIGRKFQYVSTIDKKVLSYDVRYFEEE